MTEHEKLKAICDKIGYEPIYYWYKTLKRYYKDWKGEAGVREIIFTQEFMERLKLYHWNNIVSDVLYEHKMLQLFDNLDNPVDYLYNLIF